MARKRRRSNRKRTKKEPPLITIIIAMAVIAGFLLRIALFIITFVYELVTFHTSGYKDKTNVGFLKTYFNKGNYGEFSFYRRLARIIDKENIFVNVYLDNINTDLTEVDMIAISNNGVYVFEVKNYRGYIYGSQNDRYWTQVFHRNSKFQFFNPLRQNYAHIKAVENILNVPAEQIIPVIAFSQKSKLQKINIDDDTHVYHFNQALRLVRSYEKNSRNLLSDIDLISYRNLIPNYTHASELVKQSHIDSVTEHVENINRAQDNKRGCNELNS